MKSVRTRRIRNQLRHHKSSSNNNQVLHLIDPLHHVPPLRRHLLRRHRCPRRKRRPLSRNVLRRKRDYRFAVLNVTEWVTMHATVIRTGAISVTRADTWLNTASCLLAGVTYVTSLVTWLDSVTRKPRVVAVTTVAKKAISSATAPV